MILPELSGRGEPAKRQIVNFGGLNYGEGAADGELVHCGGLSSRGFPCLTQREGRTLQKKYDGGTSIFAWGKLCVVDGTSLIYDGKQVGTVTAGEKQFAVVNTKLCIFPDAKCLDLVSREFTDFRAERSSVQGTEVSFTGSSLKMKTTAVYANQTFLSYYMLWNEQGSVKEACNFVKSYTSAVFSETTKAWTLTGEKETAMYGLTVGDIVMLKKTNIDGNFELLTVQYTGDANNRPPIVYPPMDDKGYYAVVTGVDKEVLDTQGFAAHWEITVRYAVTKKMENGLPLSNFFKAGDAVSVTGASLGSNNVKNKRIVSVDDGAFTLNFAPGTFSAHTQTAAVTVKRDFPDLDYVCACDNRLFGCSIKDNTVYASALGFPQHFYNFDNLSGDSYAVAVGTDGDFTGCIGYSGSVLFWKEHCLHKLLGAFPAEYQLHSYNIAGLQAGSCKSMEIMNEVLYYKGTDGIYAYAGGTPYSVSRNFSGRRFRNAVAGSSGTRYYVSMQGEDGAWGLYVYDSATRLWLREDDTHALDFTSLDGVLYFLDAKDKGVYLAEQKNDEKIPWSAEFAPFTETVQERKRYTKLYFRLELSNGAWAQVETMQDGELWHKVWGATAGSQRTLTVPIMPKRGDALRVRLSGCGGCTVRSMAREFRVGSAR